MFRTYTETTDTKARKLFGLTNDTDGTFELMRNEVVDFCIQHFPDDTKFYQGGRTTLKNLVWNTMIDIRRKYATHIEILEDNLLKEHNIHSPMRTQEYFVGWVRQLNRSIFFSARNEERLYPTRDLLATSEREILSERAGYVSRNPSRPSQSIRPDATHSLTTATPAVVVPQPSSRPPQKHPRRRSGPLRSEIERTRKAASVSTSPPSTRASTSPFSSGQQPPPTNLPHDPLVLKPDWSKVILCFKIVNRELPNIRVPMRLLLHNVQEPDRGVYPEELTIRVINKYFSAVLPSHANLMMEHCHIRLAGSTEPPILANDGELGVIVIEWEETPRPRMGAPVLAIDVWDDFESSLTATSQDSENENVEEQHEND